MLKKAFLPILWCSVLLVILIALLTYFAAFKPNVCTEHKVYELFIYPQENLDSSMEKIDTMLNSPEVFQRLCQVFRVKEFKTGRYLLKPGMNNWTILNKLRAGVQDPVHLAFNSARDLEQLSAKLEKQLMIDSSEILRILKDSSYWSAKGYSPKEVMTAFIPNTYQVYWNISALKLIERLLQERDKFWSKKERISQAEKLNLSPKEIYILSSIVEKETNVSEEKSMIAGVYLNRLSQGMKLQADPTVVFALGLTGLQRVLYDHLKIDSPYNTYLYDGLPPGPICMPSVETLDSVLSYEGHEYLFFCAKPGYDGSHLFAKSLSGHYQNARVYKNWLDKENIR